MEGQYYQFYSLDHYSIYCFYCHKTMSAQQLIGLNNINKFRNKNGIR